MSRLASPRAVTFDCWGTLIYEIDTGAATDERVAAILRAGREASSDVSAEAARAACDAAWTEHQRLWHEGISSGSNEMARWALESLGVADEQAAEPLAAELAEAAEKREIGVLPGARDTLLRLAERDVRRALICDTGFSPGRVVRRLLDRHGLLELLEVQIFSDEAGVPKPSPRVFHAALGALDVTPQDSVHVGDIRRSDIAGARGVGMGAVRIRQINDDQSEHPEADAVADSHAHLVEILGIA